MTRGRPLHTPSAFTLIELLVAVAIIALLMAVLLPTLARARREARTVVCGSHIRQLAVANHMYATDFGRLVPFSYFAPERKSASGAKGVNVRWCWADDTSGDPMLAFKNGMLSRYLHDSTQIAGCPSFATPHEIVNMYKTYNLAYPLAVHYGYNGLLLGFRHENFYVSDLSVPGYRLWVGYKPEEIESAGTKVMFADAGELMASNVVATPTLSPPIAVEFPNKWPRALVRETIHARHPGERANVMWVDGHGTCQRVRFYADQSEAARRAKLGFLAPDNSGERSNSWMFVK